MNAFLTSRWSYAALLLVCGGLLGFGLFLEHVRGLEPCPLCVFQRLAFMATGVVALVALLHGPGRVGGLVYACLVFITSITGATIAGRQVWLQHLPADQVPACGPGLDYMLEVFPLQEVLQMVFSGSGECAEVQWRFLGLSIPEWSLACFAGFIILAVMQWLAFRKTTAT